VKTLPFNSKSLLKLFRRKLMISKTKNSVMMIGYSTRKQHSSSLLGVVMLEVLHLLLLLETTQVFSARIKSTSVVITKRLRI